jgi:hypothetical protein
MITKLRNAIASGLEKLAKVIRPQGGGGDGEEKPK